MEQKFFDRCVMRLQQETKEEKALCERSVRAIEDKWTGYFEDSASDRLKLNDIEVLLKQTRIQICDDNSRIKTLDQLLEEMGSVWHKMSILEHTLLGIVFAGTEPGDAKRFHVLMRNYTKEYIDNKCVSLEQ